MARRFGRRACVSLIGLGMAFVPVLADAQQTAAPRPEGAAPLPLVGTPATVIDNKAVQSLLGRKVESDAGEDMGSIVDLLVDKAGQPRAAVVDFGGFFGVGSRKIAVDWHALHFNLPGKADAVVVELPRAQLRTAPLYKDDEPVVVLGRSDSPDGKPRGVMADPALPEPAAK